MACPYAARRRRANWGHFIIIRSTATDNIRSATGFLEHALHLYLPRWLPPYLGHCLQPNVCQRQPPRNVATKAFCITNLGAHGPKAGKKMVVFQTEASKPITIKGVLIPLAPTKYEQHAHHEHIELYPKTLSLFGVDNGELAAALNDHNMVFQLQFDSESPPPFLYIAIHNTIHQHLNGQNVKFAHNPHNIPSSLTDLGQYQGWTNTQHFDLYQQMPWVLATLGKSGAEHRKVNVVPTMPTDWTPQLLSGCFQGGGG
ncbi:hypothetical protein C8F01DRAFT_1282843 [Mycena amicta]|nr:hypothetical protein C8F01DRAFT_1282843 [Mycena amicta]